MTLVEPFTLNTSPVFAELMGRSLGERRSAYGDPAWRRRVVDGWANGEGIVPRWDTFEVMESAAHPHLVGRRLDSLPCDAGSNSLDVLLDLALAEPDLLLRVRCVLANDDPEGVATLLNEDGCVLGLSDAGAHVSQLCDAALPTDLLGNWVGDRRALTLEKAVHKLTGEPAALFGFADRGVLRQGARADVVVFDPASIGPGPIRRVRDFPAASERLTSDSPTGIERVYVNGSLVLDRNHLVESTLDELPGQQLVCSPR
jgi:N-acyl-D-aspartate/D-glutamate deacylase